MAIGASAQQFLAVENIREDVVLLKDSGLRVVLMCSSINFALKSTDDPGGQGAIPLIGREG